MQRFSVDQVKSICGEGDVSYVCVLLGEVGVVWRREAYVHGAHGLVAAHVAVVHVAVVHAGVVRVVHYYAGRARGLAGIRCSG